jgi:hypothetical protein
MKGDLWKKLWARSGNSEIDYQRLAALERRYIPHLIPAKTQVFTASISQMHQ